MPPRDSTNCRHSGERLTLWQDATGAKRYEGDSGSRAALAEFLLRYLDDGPAKAGLAAGAPPCQVYRAYSWARPHPPA